MSLRTSCLRSVLDDSARHVRPVTAGGRVGLRLLADLLRPRPADSRRGKSAGRNPALHGARGGGSFGLVLEPELVPVSRDRAETAPCRSRRERPNDGATILVVDDEPRMRRLARRMLSALGYRVIEVDNADAALQALEKDGGVDLLFADVVMPGGMNGRDLGNWVRKHRPRVKVLLTSGFPQQDEGEPLPFLKKPYSEEQLEEAIRLLLSARTR